MNDKIITLTDETFDEAVDASVLPILVDFWADWCGPCLLLDPVLARIAGEQSGKLRIGRIDVEANTEVARRFDVSGLPTLILLQDGVAMKRISGAINQRTLLQELSEFL